MLLTRRRSRILVGASVVGFVLFTGVSWAIAPPPAPAGEPADIVHPAEFRNVSGDGAKYYDVGRMPDGSIRGAFEDTTVECPANVSKDCARTGVRVFDPETGAVEWEYSWLSYQQFSTEVHDAEYLPNRGEMLIADMERERIFAVDMETKAITWQWKASSLYDALKNPLTADWLHINDVDRVKPGVYMVSVRNADQVLFIGRDCTCLTDVINRASDTSVLNKQHNPQYLGDGRVLVSDSENNRVVELQRQSAGEWEIVWTLYEAGGIEFDWPRDADRLPNGNTLITDTGNRRIVEVTRDGKVVRAIRIQGDGHVYEADANGSEYPAGPTYDGGLVAPVRKQPLGVVTTLYGGLRYWSIEYGVPLPYWTNEWHVFWALASLLGVIIGVGDEVRARRQRGEVPA